jgi:hypothetical protein
MVVAELDDIQYDLEIDGEQVRRQLARRVWERAGWATIAIAFVERDRQGEWRPPKLALLRFRRVHEVWKKQAAITLAADEATALLDQLGEWRTLLATASP